MGYYHHPEILGRDEIVSTDDPRGFPYFSPTFIKGSWSGQVDSILQSAKEGADYALLSADLDRAIDFGIVNPSWDSLSRSQLIALVTVINKTPLAAKLTSVIEAKFEDPSIIFNSSFLRGQPSGQLKSLAKNHPNGLSEVQRRAMKKLLQGKTLSLKDEGLARRLGVLP